MDDGAPEALACRCRVYLWFWFFRTINQVVGMLGGNRWRRRSRACSRGDGQKNAEVGGGRGGGSFGRMCVKWAQYETLKCLYKHKHRSFVSLHFVNVGICTTSV